MGASGGLNVCFGELGQQRRQKQEAVVEGRGGLGSGTSTNKRLGQEKLQGWIVGCSRDGLLDGLVSLFIESHQEVALREFSKKQGQGGHLGMQFSHAIESLD